MELINTIEINPYDFTNSNYKSPNGSSKDLPNEWDMFWRKCLSDSNLESLQSIRKGSYLVDIKSIESNQLQEIIKNKLRGIDLLDYKEQIVQIGGGIVLKVEKQFVIEPTCCGDLGNIKEWLSIFEEQAEDWEQLWIGHPWIFYRKVNDYIEFSDYYEQDIESIRKVKPLLKISGNTLKEKLLYLHQEQNKFESRIQIVLEHMNIKNSKEIARLMTGN